MIIESSNEYEGKIYKLKYWDLDTFNGLELSRCKQIYAVCFVNNKIVIGRNGKKNTWSLVGGSVEKDESIEQTLIREVQEESNMKVLKHRPIGVQEVTDPDGTQYYQLRSVCIVEPYGEFVEDPAGSVMEIKLIDPRDYKQYFDWGQIGERIIERAIILARELRNDAQQVS